MLVNNLGLAWQKTEADKIFFLDANNQEIVLPKNIFSTEFDQSAKVFLSIDTQTLVASEENKKDVLNELLKQD
ncbi:MAG: hypothetical protein UR94_C0011G0005 [Parcubacteria group bacterium GW2011_GWA2_36_10]|nr:MAG: hypothetical protein UR94_C0011G0005 [Parcubacteria group bacterium GW2011_GWA2_36_10]